MSGTLLLFLGTALFMGWSLGANDAANVFGTAVGTRMVSFRKAAFISSVCVLLGALTAGEGASEGLRSLAAVHDIPSSAIVTLSAALSVLIMTRFALPVSTSQAIIGALSGYALLEAIPLDIPLLLRIAATWIYSPVLAALLSALLTLLIGSFLKKKRIHLLTIDAYTRWLLIAAGAAGSYALGANNIANVTGIFLPAFTDQKLSLLPWVRDISTQLFLIGSLAIALGIITYSKRVMMSVGSHLFQLSPVDAFTVVLSTAMVLFLFSSTSLHSLLKSGGLPAPPLIPVSQSQASVGAVLGIAVARKAWHSIRITLLIKIAVGWIVTPVVSGSVAYLLLCIF